MRNIINELSSVVLLLFLFAPSVWGIVSILLNVYRRKLQWSSDSVYTGFCIHFINTLISPCVPLYFLYVDNKVGGGSIASLLSIPLIPVTWALYFYARHKTFQKPIDKMQ